MNKCVISFLHRGLIFGGFGPLVMGVVYLIISLCVEDFSLGGSEVFIAILSTYLLAFVHAGASVFNQIEEWPIAKSLLFHFGSLYLAYSLCYIVNAWIPFNIFAFIIFTLIFVLAYFIIWGVVYICVKKTGKRLNCCLR